jgi:hypothetical protein
VVDEKATWFRGWLETPGGRVALISTHMGFRDKVGACRVRWGIRRMHYNVPAGLYAVGQPTPESPVLVTANYKLSFDLLRRELSGMDLWLLVLETFGINVWCAAGKGTFGTVELIGRVQKVELDKLVKHRTIILPQLGASGVAPHRVRKATGFRVKYGPIRAHDLPSFLSNGLKASEENRRVKFTLRDRLVLTPVELVGAWKPSLVVLLLVFIIAGLTQQEFSLQGTLSRSLSPALIYFGALLMGSLVTPLLLPWIPGRAFSLKGAQIGLLWAFVVSVALASTWSLASITALFLIVPAIAAYFAMNFTGCSTFTSLSGVQKEMRFAVPVIILSILSGGVALLLGKFL